VTRRQRRRRQLNTRVYVYACVSGGVYTAHISGRYTPFYQANACNDFRTKFVWFYNPLPVVRLHAYYNSIIILSYFLSSLAKTNCACTAHITYREPNSIQMCECHNIAQNHSSCGGFMFLQYYIHRVECRDKFYTESANFLAPDIV